MEKKEIWTIGHSTHQIEKFISMLHSFNIEALVDIRSLPGSNHFPQYNKENLELEIPQNNIEYFYIKGLGGLRKATKDSHNTIWKVASFRNYADYMETDEFKISINELLSIAIIKHTAIMCAEAVWWRCHRSMVSDYLKNMGWKVNHIMAIDKSEEHPYTKPARIIEGKLVYGEK